MTKKPKPKPKSQRVTPRWKAAVHEAGHVVAIIEAWSADAIEVVALEGSAAFAANADSTGPLVQSPAGGRCGGFTKTLDGTMTWRSGRADEALAIGLIANAGWRATQRIYKRRGVLSALLSEARSDYSAMDLIAEDFCGEDPPHRERDAFDRWIWARTDGLLERRWKDVETIAAALDERGSLTGADVAELVATTAGAR